MGDDDGDGGIGLGDAIGTVSITSKIQTWTRHAPGRERKEGERKGRTRQPARHKPLYEFHILTHHLGRDPVPLEIGHERAPRGLDVLGGFNDAARIDADVGDVYERVRSGARDDVRLDGLGWC